jgi:hypothetical protein
MRDALTIALLLCIQLHAPGSHQEPHLDYPQGRPQE